MLVDYLENAIPVVVNAAAARLRYGDSSKIKKRDLKALEKKLALEKDESSIYDFKPPKDVQELIRSGYEEMMQ